MLKYIALLFMTLVTLFAENITVSSKWQLLGAQSDINLSIFKNSCTDIIWTYKDKKWKLFIANDKNYDYPYRIDKLRRGDGFWIKGHDECNITIFSNPLFLNLNVGVPASSIPLLTDTNQTTWIDIIDIILDKDIENNLKNRKIYKYNPFSFYYLHKNIKNAKFLIYWLTQNWNESWFNLSNLQKAVDSGYIPVFNYWYFGDKLESMPTKNEEQKYYDNAKKVAKFLNKIKGQKLLIMEPEFNKNFIVSDEKNSHKFAKIVSNAIDIIKSIDKNISISLCMMDTGNRSESATYPKCGYENCSYGDKYEWSKSQIVYNDLLDKLDFISFQQMVGQFHRDGSGTWTNPHPIAMSDKESGIKNLSQRIVNFTKFLYEKYHKPIFLPYLAIASATWDDKNGDGTIQNSEIDKDGWNKYIEKTYKVLKEKRDILEKNGLFGYAPMELIDNPRHDYGGYQYFLNNEYHLGLMKTSAKDEVDIRAYGDLTPKGSDIFENIYQQKEQNSSNIIHQKSILIPLYSYPNWYDSNYLWKDLINLKKSHDNVNIIAIVNPNNGDFNSQNSDFVQGIKDLSFAGIKVVGYVYTKYGNRDIDKIKENIDSWNNFYKIYGVRGIFFDETSTSLSDLDFYKDITSYAKQKGLDFIILNPGITTNQKYITSKIADIIVSYENPYEDLTSSPPTEYNTPTDNTKLALLIYNMQGDKVDELYNFFNSHDFEYFYFTEDDSSNPWDTISKYLEKEIKKIEESQ